MHKVERRGKKTNYCIAKRNWNSPKIEWWHLGFYLYTESVASIKTTGIKLNRLYTIWFRNFGIALCRVICAVVLLWWAIVKNRFERLIFPDFLFIKTLSTRNLIWKHTLYNVHAINSKYFSHDILLFCFEGGHWITRTTLNWRVFFQNSISQSTQPRHLDCGDCLLRLPNYYS